MQPKTAAPSGTCQNGLTLIEMMLALAIGAVVLTLTAPAFDRFVQRQRIDVAAHELVSHINLARLDAVTRRHLVLVCPSLDGRSCTGDNRWEDGWIVFRDDDRNRRVDADDELLRIGAPIEALSIDSAGRTLIRYQPDGTAGGTNLTLKLCHDEMPELARAVIVSNPGRPRVDDLPGHLSCPAG